MVCGEKKKPFLGAFPFSSEEKGKTWFESTRKLRYGISLLVWRV